MRQAAERDVDQDPEFAIFRYSVAFLKGDEKAMATIAAEAKERNAGLDQFYELQATVAAFHGKLRDARSGTRHAVDLAMRTGQRESAAHHAADMAMIEAMTGDASAARSLTDEALALSSEGRDVIAQAGLALAFANDPHAARIAEKLDRQFPEDTLVQFVHVPVIRALIAMHGDRPAQAISLLETSTPYELGWASYGGDVFL